VNIAPNFIKKDVIIAPNFIKKNVIIAPKNKKSVSLHFLNKDRLWIT